MTLWEETLEVDLHCAEVHTLREKLALKLSRTPSEYAVVENLRNAIEALDAYTGYSDTSDYQPPIAKKS